MTTKRRECKISERRFEAWLGDLIQRTRAVEQGSVNTFDGMGVLTRNKGLVVRLNDGSEFEIQIVDVTTVNGIVSGSLVMAALYPELWKPIPDHPGYETSSFGRVRSFWKQVGRGEKRLHSIIGETPRLMHPAPMSSGYLRTVLLDRHGKRRGRLIHNLVLEAFIGPRPGRLDARHINGKPDDNRVENLYWGTRSRNMIDRIYHSNENYLKSIKLNPDTVRAIRDLLRQGVRQRVIAGRFGITQSTVSAIHRGKIWSHLQ